MAKKFRYFEDYQVGQSSTEFPAAYPARTVTTADIVYFGCLTGDYAKEHFDKRYMAKSVYGERIAHGLLGSSLVTGMLSLNAPYVIGRGVPEAYFYGFVVDYRGGIRIDDTINIRWRITEKTDATAYQGFGLVKTTFEIENQEGVYVYNGNIFTLVRKESAKDAKLQLKPGVPWQVEELVTDPDKVCYAEDYPIGKGGESEGRTITEADVVRFAGLTGDYDPRYVDAEFAKKDTFGERIAHGMLVFTAAFAQQVQDYRRRSPRRPAVGFAGHLYDKGTFLFPVKIGDTIRCQYRIASARVSKSKPEVGIIVQEFQIINQRNEVVQVGSFAVMTASRAAAAIS